MSAGPIRGKATCAAFTLVEVLVVMVVLATGLLGTAALLLEGLRASRQAIEQTRATDLVADLANRIHANPLAGVAYELSADRVLPPPTRSCAVPNDCGSLDLAERDLYEWQQAAVDALPGAQTRVDVTPAAQSTANIYTIVIEWRPPGQASPSKIDLVVQA